MGNPKCPFSRRTPRHGGRPLLSSIPADASANVPSVKLILAITRGIIRDTATRRWAMFALVLVAAVMLFLGSTFLSNWLFARPILFGIFWIVCAWLTLTAIMLALFDMLMIRANARAAARRLKTEVFDDEDDS